MKRGNGKPWPLENLSNHPETRTSRIQLVAVGGMPLLPVI